MYDLSTLDAEKWLALNAQLQQKKNLLRRELAKMGILKRDGENKFDHYKYFSEAKYKELFTDLFAKNGLELNFNELEYDTFAGSEKQSNGRMPKIEFYLIDAQTGFYESTRITGEGMDKGDKAGYKAYTGALKYFLADKFLVATGDDQENDSPDEQANDKTVRQSEPASQTRYASKKQIEILMKIYTGEKMKAMLDANGLKSIDYMTMEKASELISKLRNIGKVEGGENNE